MMTFSDSPLTVREMDRLMGGLANVHDLAFEIRVRDDPAFVVDVATFFGVILYEPHGPEMIRRAFFAQQVREFLDLDDNVDLADLCVCEPDPEPAYREPWWTGSDLLRIDEDDPPLYGLGPNWPG